MRTPTTCEAAGSESESVRVYPFAWMESESKLESEKYCRSDSVPESQYANRQQTMILAERLCIVPKTLKGRKKMREEIKLKRHLVLTFRLIKGIWDNFGVV